MAGIFVGFLVSGECGATEIRGQGRLVNGEGVLWKVRWWARQKTARGGGKGVCDGGILARPGDTVLSSYGADWMGKRLGGVVINGWRLMLCKGGQALGFLRFRGQEPRF